MRLLIVLRKQTFLIKRCCSTTQSSQSTAETTTQSSQPSAETSLQVNWQLIRQEEQEKLLKQYAPQRLPPLLSLTDLLKLYKVRSQKRLSQNFLINPKLTKDFIRISGIYPGCSVLEIGPGPGSLTRRILECGPKELIVIEKDRRFLPILEMLADAGHPGQMKIMLGDILDYTLAGIFPDDCKREWEKASNVYLISNLPFSVSTEFLVKMLHQCYTRTGLFSYGRVKMTLGFQREVGKRITAPVLSLYRSRLSVMTQLFMKARIKKKIKGKSFVPKPEVDAAVVKMIPLKEPLIRDVPFDVIEHFIRVLFHLRNAYSSKSIKFLFPGRKQNLTFELFRRARLDPIITPTMLSTEEIAELIKIYWEFIQENPELREHDFRMSKGEPALIREMFWNLGSNEKLINEAIKREFFAENGSYADELLVNYEDKKHILKKKFDRK